MEFLGGTVVRPLKPDDRYKSTLQDPPLTEKILTIDSFKEREDCIFFEDVDFPYSTG